jgi:hypothetical protein
MLNQTLDGTFHGKRVLKEYFSIVHPSPDISFIFPRENLGLA